MANYRFIIDSGHGWLEVPIEDVIAAGVFKKISGFSSINRKKNLMYLEEDCDAAVFMRAKKLKYGDFTEVCYDGMCFVRKLPQIGE